MVVSYLKVLKFCKKGEDFEEKATDEILTLARSLLSALLAKTKPIQYNMNVRMIVSRTLKLSVSSRRLSSLKTVSMSIGLGATKRPPPNDVRWLQRQRRRCLLERGPTWGVKE